VSGHGLAPLPVIALAAGGATLAFASEQPAIVFGVLAGALVLYRLAPRRASAIYLLGGAVSALGLILMTPFVSAGGDHIVVRGPEVAVLDTEITLEELAAGAISGARILAVTLLIGALLAQMDGDRLLAMVSRLAPRSAVVCALSARLLPTLERDAAGIAESARLRGLDLGGGRRLARARRAAPLVLPLLGASLERGLDVAEAMAARGYGRGVATRLPEPATTAGERALALIGIGLLALGAVALFTGLGDYELYPRLGPVADPVALAVGAAAALGLSAATWVARAEAR
jgi:energy-coupling factor transport system permease protein